MLKNHILDSVVSGTAKFSPLEKKTHLLLAYWLQPSILFYRLFNHTGAERKSCLWQGGSWGLTSIISIGHTEPDKQTSGKYAWFRPGSYQFVHLWLEYTTWDYMMGLTWCNAPPWNTLPKGNNLVARRLGNNNPSWVSGFLCGRNCIFCSEEHSIMWASTCSLAWYSPDTGLPHQWELGLRNAQLLIQDQRTKGSPQISSGCEHEWSRQSWPKELKALLSASMGENFSRHAAYRK